MDIGLFLYTRHNNRHNQHNSEYVQRSKLCSPRSSSATCCECSQFVDGCPGEIRILVFVALRTNDCQQTRSNHEDMSQLAAVAREFVVMLAETYAGDEIKPSHPFIRHLGRFEKRLHLIILLPPSLDRHHRKLHDIPQQCNELGRRVFSGDSSSRGCNFVPKTLRQTHNFSNILTCGLWIKLSIEN